jgi:poly(A) polymerase
MISPNADRAMQALMRAVACAERGEADSPIVLVSPDDLRSLQPDDLRAPLDRLMVAEHADLGLDSLLASGVLDVLFPEVQKMVGFGDGEWRHKDVWKHTKQVVTQAVPNLEIRWAALFHDIGKVKTRTFGPDGEVHFFGHAEVGARMFDKLERREHLFGSEEALRTSIRFLVLHHLRASQYDGQWTDSAVRRFAREMGPHLEGLLCLSRADITTKRPEKKRRGISLINQLADRITHLAAEDAVRSPLPKGLGTALMASFGIPPSKRVGDLIRALEAAVADGELPADQEAGFYVEFLAENRERFGLGGKGDEDAQ